MNVAGTLRARGIQPSAQRVAIGSYVLQTGDHPSADDVFQAVTKSFPHVSRATIYNTLNLFVEKGLLRSLTMSEGRVVFDPRLERHHHFVDEASGRIVDVPWHALEVGRIETLTDFEVSDYQVVLRGRCKPSP